MKNDETSELVNVLPGVCWLSSADMLQYTAEFELNEEINKRIVLSLMSRLFDQLGMVNAIIFSAKIFMQKLWKLKFGWDEPLAINSRNEWKNIQSELSALNKLSIPRQVTVADKSVQYCQITLKMMSHH